MPDETPALPPIYVSAFLCQEVLRDATNLLTAIRITNAFSVSPVLLPETELEGGGTLDPQLVYPTLKLHAIVLFNSEQPAEFDVELKPFGPDGKELNQNASPIKCQVKGGAEGHALNLNINLRADIPGDWWVEVHIDGRFATKMPMRIVHEMPKAMIMLRTKADTHPSGQSQAPSTAVSE
jgi:hypothetical protein